MGEEANLLAHSSEQNQNGSSPCRRCPAARAWSIHIRHTGKATSTVTEDLTAGSLTRGAGGEVHRSAEHVTVALYGRAVVETCSGEWEAVEVRAPTQESLDQCKPSIRGRRCQQDGITDRLDQPVARAQNSRGEPCEGDRQVGSVFVAVRFGQGGVPGQIHHGEGPLGRGLLLSRHGPSHRS